MLQKDSTTSCYAYIPPKGDSVILLNDKKDAYRNAEFTPIDNTLSMVKKDGTYGMTDSESGLMVPCIYDSIKPIENVKHSSTSLSSSSGMVTCNHCNGTGKCPICKGTGKCAKCHGTGKMKK